MRESRSNMLIAGSGYVQENGWLRIAASFVILVALLSGLARPTFAQEYDEDINATTGDPGFTPADLANGEKRITLAQEYRDVKEGLLSMQTYLAHVDEYMISLGITDTTQFHPQDRMEICPSSQNGSCVDPTEQFGTPDPAEQFGPDAAWYERNILWSVPNWNITQPNSYYCGPATAFAILYHWRAWNSRFEPQWDTLTQQHIARTCISGSHGCETSRGRYLMTDAYGETPWNATIAPFKRIFHMKYGLNKWLWGREDQAYWVVGAPNAFTVQTFRNHLTFNIDHSWPLAVNVVELAGDTTFRLVGHPTDRTIYHWVAARGYSVWGNTVHYVDSAYGANLGWPSYPPSSNQRLEVWKMHYMMQQPGYQRGYVW